MPKVPQVLSSGDTGFTGGARLNPEGFANLATSGTRALIGTVDKAAQDYQQVYATLRTEAEKLEAEKALGEAQRQFADADVALKTDPTITAETYPQEVARQLKTIREGVGKSLQYPGARAMFERGVEQFTTQQTIKAKYEGVEMLNGQVRASTDLVIRDDVNQAVFGPTPEIQDAALNRALGRISGLTSRRIYSGTESASKTAMVLAQVEEGRIRRDVKNPILAPEIIANLQKGTVYTALGIEGQRQLAASLIQEQKAAEDAFTKQRKEAEAEVAQEAEKGIQDSITAGNWSAARGFLSGARKFLPGTRYEHWATTIANREGQGKPSNPEVYKPLNVAANSIKGDPGAELAAATAARDRIEAAYRDNQLDDKDYNSLIGKANTRITKSQDAKLTAVGREHAQAEQMVNELIRVPEGPLSQFMSQQAQNLKSMAIEDLTRNSAYIGQGNEPPLAWYARRKAFYAAQLQQVASQRVGDIAKQLTSVGAKVGVPLTDGASIVRARASFRNEADYYDALRLAREAQQIIETQASFKPPPTPSAAGQTATPATPASPAPAATPVKTNPLGRR